MNEDSKVVIANLSFSQDANLEEVTVAAVQPSGRELASLPLALAHPEAVPEMCRAISSQSGVDPRWLRCFLMAASCASAADTIFGRAAEPSGPFAGVTMSARGTCRDVNKFDIASALV